MEYPEPSSCFQTCSTFYDNVKKNSQLRECQIEAIERIKESNHEIRVAVLPTGSGKTAIIAMLPYALMSKRTLVVEPSIPMRNQMYKALNVFDNIENSIYIKLKLVGKDQTHILPQGNFIPTKKTVNECGGAGLGPLVITNPHKFTDSKGKSKNADEEANPEDDIGISEEEVAYVSDLREDFFDLIIIDEAHHLPSETWNTILKKFPNALKVFLTATPYRADGLEICEGIEEKIVYRLTRDEAIQKGYIRESKFTTCKDFDEVIDNLVKEVARRKEEKIPHKGIIICDSIGKAKEIAKNINKKYSEELGLKAIEYYGNIKDKNKKLQQFETGHYDIIVIVKLLLEGYDHPLISVCGVCRNISSPLVFSQFVGRSFRVTDVNVIAHIFGTEKAKVLYENLDTFTGDKPKEKSNERKRKREITNNRSIKSFFSQIQDENKLNSL